MPMLLLSQPASIATGPVNSSLPVASGTQSVGGTVSCTSGSWTFTTSISYAYQWQSSANGIANWTDIPSAANSAYVIDIAQFGQYLRCVVTATDANGSASADSNLVGPAPTAAARFQLTPNEDFIFQLTPNASVRVTLVLIPNPIL